ncbi:MAG: phosphoadenylyl-sulfate reductase [Coriobacteriaceae bacterium]|nr:phosphoadenylyl-sulfate reductase [Coriobacteriaceae bacterium]
MTGADQIDGWNAALEHLDAPGILTWAAETFPGRVALASSLGLEDQVLTGLVVRDSLAIPVFTIDTGRLFQESHELIDRTRARYGIAVRVLFPDAAEVEPMVAEHGTELFRTSVELRKRCCAVRKLGPLRRALEGLDAWVCGLRRGQAVTRSEVAPVEWDEANGLVKVNPLWDWTGERVREHVREHDVPYNPLHDRDFPSIGCAPCTRAVAPGEDARAGRWWWEAPEHRECGLHARRSPGDGET